MNKPLTDIGAKPPLPPVVVQQPLSVEAQIRRLTRRSFSVGASFCARRCCGSRMDRHSPGRRRRAVAAAASLRI